MGRDVFAKSVYDLDGQCLHGHDSVREPIGFCGDFDFAGLHGAAEQYAVHATLHGEAFAQYVIVGALGYAATPFGGTVDLKADHAVVERTTTPPGIDHLNLHQRHVGPVGMETLRILYRGQQELPGLAGCLDFISARLPAVTITYGLECAGLKLNILKRKEIIILPLAVAERTAVDKQLDIIAGGDHIDGLDGVIAVIPVAYYIGAVALVVNPSVGPHHLMGIKAVLGYAHRVGDSRTPVVLGSAIMGVGVGEDYLDSATVAACPRSRTLDPVIIPAAHEFDGHTVLIMVVVRGIRTLIERTLPLFMEWVGILVPILSETLVATILHGPHGVFGRAVDIKHLASILGVVNIQHLARTDGAAAVRVITVAYGLHRIHVFGTDAEVARLIKQYGGIVTVIDYGIAHHLLALLPLTPLTVFLGVARRHSLDETYAVTRLDILLPRGDMHPAYKVAARLDHESVGIITEPRRHGEPDGRPLVGGALGITVYLYQAVVEPYLALAKTCLSEPRACRHLVDAAPLVVHKLGVHIIEITVTPAPEIQTADTLGGFQDACLAGGEGEPVAIEGFHLFAVGIPQRHAIGKRGG